MKASSIEALPDALLERIATGVAARSFPKHAVLVVEGDDTDSLFVLLSGRVRAYVSADDGRELEVNRMGRGEYFGEVMLDGGPRSASVAAIEDCRCVVVRRAELTRLLAQVPELAQHMIRKLAHRLRTLTEHTRDLALMDVYGRVARLLLDVAEDVDGRLVIREALTQRDIGSRVGCSREMVSRIFSDLTAGGYLSREGRTIVILKTPPARW
jgi:CRP/FNR family cyclic AMP-dependent transcriptional regulator